MHARTDPPPATPGASLRERLAGSTRPLVLDGALATELEAAGFDLSDALWSARVLRDDPDAIRAVHRAYVDAGAEVLISASYQASVAGFARIGVGEEDAAGLLALSVRIAREARGDRTEVLVAASVGPYGAVLAGGQEYTGDYGGIGAEELERFHEPRLAALLSARPDCVACETIPLAAEAAVLARVLDRLEAPDAWISFSCRDGASTTGGDPIEAAIAAATASSRVVAVGVNCTAPEHVEPLLCRARAATDLPLVAYPNSGRVWDGAARKWSEPGARVLPAAAVERWAAAGARLIGGCCGLGPPAIRALAAADRA